MTTQPQLEINERGAIYVPEYITLQGTIQRIIFHNPQNGYCVISVVPTLEKETLNNVLDDESITANNLKLTGHLAAPREGDEYRFTGTWVNHPRFGKQLKFTDAELILPVGKSGVARYLSQITHGVGVKKAEKIVAALGENALEQIRENPEALNHPDLAFLTDTQKEEITADLTKNSVQAELAALICGPGIGMGTVMRIMREFGQDAVAKIKENPYVLCSEVYGIGFKTADSIALRTGIPKNSPFRVDAALMWVLSEAANEGH
ncbi:MAG TPA: helix-hairpin-helix domain-containing protein, partial [Candidatus Hydrogenedentes bacterium]|nr:helix-hairpin-helix domain-containing protein [Candidatus Hydrogenedentota bacterium]